MVERKIEVVTCHVERAVSSPEQRFAQRHRANPADAWPLEPPVDCAGSKDASLESGIVRDPGLVPAQAIQKARPEFCERGGACQAILIDAVDRCVLKPSRTWAEQLPHFPNAFALLHCGCTQSANGAWVRIGELEVERNEPVRYFGARHRTEGSTPGAEGGSL